MAIFSSIWVGLFIIFFFGLCIFVHEFGHLLAGLWRGLFVERFSIGFGRRIWGFTRNGVEYVVSALPFGGYVALPQLEPSEEPETADGRKLPHAPPTDRILTALAGPVFNVLFGFFLALFVWWMGIYQTAPAPYCDVLSVPESSPEYQAGLRPEDRVTAVNGRSFTRGWTDVAQMVVLSPGEVTLRILRDGVTRDITYRPAPNPETEGLGWPFFKVRTPTVVHQIMPKSAAATAGLQQGDVVLKVDGKEIENAELFVDLIRDSAGRAMELTIARQDKVLTLENVRARAARENGKTVFRIGAVLDAPVVLTHVNPWRQFTNVLTTTRDTLHSLLARHSLVKARHMSGPIGIAQMIGLKVYYGGFRDGLSFIVFVSFSLALFNLLPIPVLDGGHIFLAAVELVSRRRVPVRVAYVLQVTCASLLIGFMLYVTFFDIKRFGTLFNLLPGHERSKTEQTAPAKTPGKPPPREVPPG